MHQFLSLNGPVEHGGGDIIKEIWVSQGLLKKLIVISVC